MKIRVLVVGCLVTLFYASSAFPQSYVLESTDITNLSTDSSAAAGTVWENQFYALGIDESNGLVVYYPDGTSNRLEGVSGPIYDADGKWIMAETEDVYNNTIIHFGARIDLISEDVFLMQAPDEFPIVNIHFGLDESGGTSGASGGLGPVYNPSFICPGMSSAAVIQYNDMVSRFGMDIDCSSGTLLATFTEIDESGARVRKSLVVEDIFDSPITKDIGVPTRQDFDSSGERLDSIFYRISQSQFDPAFTALIQNSATKGRASCLLYRGSSGQTTAMQFRDSCISLTNNFVVFQDADDQCTVMNTDGDRLPLIQQSTGTTYTGCVDADEINDSLYVTVDFGGTTSVVIHPISSTNPGFAPQLSSANIFGDCIDADGDGWGWDGEKSCRIPLSVQNSNENSADICVDTPPLNDGWGWNFAIESTCRMLSFPDVGESESAIDQSLSCIDTDGDGFGWTGTQSCRFDEQGNIVIL